MHDLLSKVVVRFIGVCLLISTSVCFADDALGAISKQQLIDGYHEFSENYKSYIASEDELQAIDSLPNGVSIKVYFATWCHDSEREVPRLLNVFKQNNSPIELIALDYDKSEPLGQAKVDKIKYTPTFIVYLNEKEVGRIIESPKVSLAEDIQAMLHEST